MSTKAIVGGLIGGIVYFLIGWLVYGVLMKDAMSGIPCMRTPETMSMIWILVGNLFSGLLMGYLLSKMAGANSAKGGAMAGLVIGLLFSAGYDCLMYGTTTMMDSPTGIVMDVIMSGVMSAIVGAVVGWWLSRP